MSRGGGGEVFTKRIICQLTVLYRTYCIGYPDSFCELVKQTEFLFSLKLVFFESSVDTTMQCKKLVYRGLSFNKVFLTIIFSSSFNWMFINYIIYCETGAWIGHPPSSSGISHESLQCSDRTCGDSHLVAAKIGTIIIIRNLAVFESDLWRHKSYSDRNMNYCTLPNKGADSAQIGPVATIIT